jgi:hypothetical protein
MISKSAMGFLAILTMFDRLRRPLASAAVLRSKVPALLVYLIELGGFHPDGALSHQRVLNGTVKDSFCLIGRSKFTAGLSRRANA